MISEVLRKVQNEFLLNISTVISTLPKFLIGYVSDGGDCRNVNRCKLTNPISSIYSVKSDRFTCPLKIIGSMSV
ncbi:hypothetical protein [Bacillus cereus]|uniref:hypothetical protein n=1 Tax=Bacillus cereus TaxID=1396 RepID=UPI0011460F17|nr:hypothetical protein [Bacillus cereus]